MLRVSETPVEGSRKITNGGCGNRCIICGSYFDEGGICNNRHEHGGTYYVLSEEVGAEELSTPSVEKSQMVECQVFSGCKCTICGGFFADGDDICASGHQIGHKY